MMRVLNPNNNKSFTNLKDGVFLAGPCPRQSGIIDWRVEAIELFRKHGFTGDIINPTNDQYDDQYLKQINWEIEGLHLSSAIMFWVPRTEQNPSFTTNVEFGEWMKNDSVILGFPRDSMKNKYLQTRFEHMNKLVYHNLEETVKVTIDLIENRYKLYGGNTFFTSDTHFGQERTLQLSYRPFRSVRDMDLTLISNWNKRLNSESTIFHLGDFGNTECLPLLNFKKMYFLSGNYERKDGVKLNDDRVVDIVPPFVIKVKNKKYGLCHEPLNKMGKDRFYLYGHIHRLQLVKANGVNVGVDGNRFNPMSINELDFLRGGIDNHFDENVFVEYCQ